MGYKKREVRDRKDKRGKDEAKKNVINQPNTFDSIAKKAMQGASMPVAKKGNQKNLIKKLAGGAIVLVMLGVWKLIELIICLVSLCL